MTSVSALLVYPLCAMFALTVFVLVKMFLGRVRAVKAGQVKMGYFKTYSRENPPDDMLKVDRHFSNLFEAPVLFYLICVLGMILPVESIAFLVMAWIYVAARIFHAYVHIGSNSLNPRMRAYMLGWLMLIGLWAMVFLKALNITLSQAA